MMEDGGDRAIEVMLGGVKFAIWRPALHCHRWELQWLVRFPWLDRARTRALTSRALNHSSHNPLVPLSNQKYHHDGIFRFVKYL